MKLAKIAACVAVFMAVCGYLNFSLHHTVHAVMMLEIMVSWCLCGIGLMIWNGGPCVIAFAVAIWWCKYTGGVNNNA